MLYSPSPHDCSLSVLGPFDINVTSALLKCDFRTCYGDNGHNPSNIFKCIRTMFYILWDFSSFYLVTWYTTVQTRSSIIIFWDLTLTSPCFFYSDPLQSEPKSARQTSLCSSHKWLKSSFIRILMICQACPASSTAHNSSITISSYSLLFAFSYKVLKLISASRFPFDSTFSILLLKLLLTFSKVQSPACDNVTLHMAEFKLSHFCYIFTRDGQLQYVAPHLWIVLTEQHSVVVAVTIVTVTVL